MKVYKTILWVRQKFGGATANARYYELLRRLTCITQIGYPPFKGVYRLERFVMPRALPLLARRFRVLFDPGARFTAWWPGPTIVDVDDPTFAPEEISVLRDSRIELIVTTTPQLAYRLSTETGKPVHVIPSGFSARDINTGMVRRIHDQLKKAVISLLGTQVQF